MAVLKTAKTSRSVAAFLKEIQDEGIRTDCRTLVRIMEEITGSKASLWGTSIVGFGMYHYRYESGREGDWFLAGFSPRKKNLTIYIMAGFDRYDELMRKLGKFKAGKSCLYVSSLEDINIPTLKQLIRESVRQLRSRYGVQ
jgi:hypothetical protein